MKHNLNPVMNAQLDRNRRIRTHRRNLSDPRFSTSLTDSLGEDEVYSLLIYYFVHGIWILKNVISSLLTEAVHYPALPSGTTILCQIPMAWTSLGPTLEDAVWAGVRPVHWMVICETLPSAASERQGTPMTTGADSWQVAGLWGMPRAKAAQRGEI